VLNLRIVQARYGDCLILGYGTQSAPRYLLIDGGPKSVYQRHLRRVLEGIAAVHGKLDLVILSHIDEDHIDGLLDLANDLLWERIRGLPELIAFDALWHNSFSGTLGADISDRLERIFDRSGLARSSLPHAAKACRDIAQGDQLTRLAHSLNVPINPGFDGGGILTVEKSSGAIKLGNLSLHIVGPTEANITELREAWQAWLEEQENRVLVLSPADAERAVRSLDSSVPNLSSIMVLAEADGRRILLTGDGTSEYLEQGLRQAGLLGPGGTLHVDILKLPHHGSKRNITADFLQRITADRYVISASGKHGHPHKNTLTWIVDRAKEQGRGIELVATNSTSSLRALVNECDPQEYGYRLTMMPEGTNEQVLELSA